MDHNSHYRKCPICGDSLEGSSNGLRVFADVQAAAGSQQPTDCSLCGMDIQPQQAQQAAARGVPPLLLNDGRIQED